MTHYPQNLHSAVVACGAPHGYRLSIRTSGALLVAALSFMVLAVAGFGTVGLFGHAPALRGNVLYIGGVIIASYLASHLLDGYAAWPLTGLATRRSR